ncbi:hypothetical protein LIER_25356 [Lithospermum erythrorhizon]|uniref:COBRA C-terminal domain-containing protein n=1 Tax=Lithospermum erythrorhizon TaxID=34254 RepID=A0AAV3R7H1_LITER
MIVKNSSMKISCVYLVLLMLCCFSVSNKSLYARAQFDSSDVEEEPKKVSKEQEMCNGIFLTYDFSSKEKLYPHLKNASAQPWSFMSTASIVNMGLYEVKAWKMFIGFQHGESIVSIDGASIVDVEGPPYKVGKNGTTIVGATKVDLKTAVDTAGDYEQMQVIINFKGTLFGGKQLSKPMPKTIKLQNDGFKCPAATKKGEQHMQLCCTRDPKAKVKDPRGKFMPRTYGDLTFTYDVLQAFSSKYLAQVTIDNNHPLSRLDRWNLTWEWQRNEFINNMRGAHTHKKDPAECIYGPQGKAFKDFDFTNVQSCAKKPIISDLPSEKIKDEKIGNLPFCCTNGTLLPKSMNETKSKAIFQLDVMKLPPQTEDKVDITPPSNWKITGQLNPTYKCGPPVRVDPSRFPDPNGLDATVRAVASWFVSCNMTTPKPHKAKCCVSFSAYYAQSAVPCPTCACGCEDNLPHCNAKAEPLPLPPNGLLVPFENRTIMAREWWKLKHKNNHAQLPKKLPCPDNCGVTINWHLESDYKSGWAARLTLFNWGNLPFQDWFTAIQTPKGYHGYENVYSFNGTRMSNNDKLRNMIFMQGLPGMNYLIAETNGTHPDKDPKVPGKQQSVISFSKKGIKMINVPKGDGFPTKVFFNGEECALPKTFPKRNGAIRSQIGLLPAFFVALLTFMSMVPLN